MFWITSQRPVDLRFMYSLMLRSCTRVLLAALPVPSNTTSQGITAFQVALLLNWVLAGFQ